ncbi:cytoskeletal protein binding protein [Paramarasmius palmivorus]|uniref:Actin cytoskeleton-regulatory complex protein SLA1 n=1 Tax=Paramarasmius palmivorus TaxID=297713 RepID=A0AAW0DH47_9AGAR
MSSQPFEEYLAVLKACYDYSPQSEDEIAIKEDQILFLIERTDEDWWKVKVKDDPQESTGLVPAAYVEQAEHTSVVKALYDYEATAEGELTVKEDDILLAFETEEDWTLVQSTTKGKAGLVPANYVEPHDEGASSATSQIVIPPDPPRPVSTYVDPAERVASAKANTDDIKTWSVSEVDKKGKKLKGTLGVGNGAVFFASETSKAAVQKWQTADITNISIDKSKHVTFDVGGANPTSLHFHAGSKDNAEAIAEKLESSKAISTASQSPAANDTPNKSPPKKASVHFSPASPTIIPPREPSEDGSYEEQEEDQPVNGADRDDDDDGEKVVVLYDFTADGDDELTVAEGEHLVVLEKDDEWWKCRNQKGREGVVPAQYVEAIASSSGASSASANAAKVAKEAAEAQAKAESQRRAEEARAKAEAEAKARAEAEAEAEAQAEAERAQKEEEERKARKKQEAKQRAEAAQAAAEAERKKRQEAAAARAEQSSPAPSPREDKRRSTSNAGSKANDNGFPPAERVRTWHDRSGQFRVDAALLGFKDGKLRLHKTNGVIVEVPSEKMSVEDMKYIEKSYNKKPKPKEDDDDNIPLAHQKRASTIRQAPKKGPTVDWFDFFLSAGCDLDDCTRYAAAFERDKIDEAILPDITEGTMRSLGLREGDIIRVKKAIDSRKPPKKDADPREAQIANDEALARQLEAQEKSGSKAAPNLFASPGGALKTSRRGRPQPSKSLPASVDINAINTVSEQIQRTSSPQLLSPESARASTSTPVQPPPRSSSALATTSGFDDDAWTNRPSSTKPIAPSPPATTARAPSAPPATATATTTAAPAAPAAAPEPPKPAAPATTSSPNSLAKTTESDIFDQLARLSELRKLTPQAPVVAAAPAPVMAPAQVPTPISNPASPPPASFMSGLGVNNSPLSMGQHLQNQQTGILPQTTAYNGPRGPFAPVPANQSLLQPLVPTQTGFNGFVPTRPGSTPSFLSSQPTGMPGTQPLMSQPTGMPFNGFNNNPSPFQANGGFQSSGNFNGPSPIMSNPTGFNPSPNFGQSPFNQSPFNQSPFNNPISSPPPVPPLPSSNAPSTTDTSPANIFAQMKSGTFANDNQSGPQGSDKYDALRPNPMVPQATGWGNFQGSSFVGYR